MSTAKNFSNRLWDPFPLIGIQLWKAALISNMTGMEPSHSRSGRWQVYDWFPGSQRHSDVGTTACFLAHQRPSSPYAQSPKRLQSIIRTEWQQHWQSRPPKLTTCAARTGITWSARCNSIGNRFVQMLQLIVSHRGVTAVIPRELVYKDEDKASNNWKVFWRQGILRS